MSIPPPDLPESFLDTYERQARSAYENANDDEIESLREALSEALGLLADAGYDLTPIHEIGDRIDEEENA